MKTLKGYRVLITGADSGIGRVMAVYFETSGAKIWICDADKNILQQCLKENSGWKGTLCDVADEDSVNKLFQEIEKVSEDWKFLSITQDGTCFDHFLKPTLSSGAKLLI